MVRLPRLRDRGPRQMRRGVGDYPVPACSPWDDNCTCPLGDNVCIAARWYSNPFRAVRDAAQANPGAYYDIQCDTCPDCHGYYPRSVLGLPAGMKPWQGGCDPGVDPLQNALAANAAGIQPASAPVPTVYTPAASPAPAVPAAPVVYTPAPASAAPLQAATPAMSVPQVSSISLAPAAAGAPSFTLGGYQVPWVLAAAVAGGLALAFGGKK